MRLPGVVPERLRSVAPAILDGLLEDYERALQAARDEVRPRETLAAGGIVRELTPAGYGAVTRPSRHCIVRRRCIGR